MKQLVFNYVDAKVFAIMISYGEVVDGTFQPRTLDGRLCALFRSAARLVHDEPIFHSGYYILPNDFDEVFQSILPFVDSFAYYPSLLVCNLNPDFDGTEEEE